MVSFKKLFLSMMLMSSMVANAQILSINDAKTKFEGGVEYREGTPIQANPDGEIHTHEALWHNFIFTPLEKVGVEFHHMSNDGGKYNPGNHYFRFGMNGMKVFMLPGYQRGIAVTANLYGEGSQHGVHHFDGVLSTLFMFSTKPKDSRGVGFIFLVNNPTKMFALPIFTWKRDFDEHWSINWMTWLGDFSYNFNKKVALTASYGFSFERYWIEENEKNCMANQILCTPSLSLQWKVCNSLQLSAAGGYQVPLMGSLFNENGTEYLHKLQTRQSWFGSAKLAYRF